MMVLFIIGLVIYGLIALFFLVACVLALFFRDIQALIGTIFGLLFFGFALVICIGGLLI